MLNTSLLATALLCAGAQAAPTATSQIKNLFVFGSSWSETKFKVDGRQPSLEFPLGNPGFDSIDTQEGGPNFAKFLTDRYNSTGTLLYDLAVGGAAIDNNLLGQPTSTIPDLGKQIGQIFYPQYANQVNKLWKGDDSIFIVWMCDNDALIGYKKPDQENLLHDLVQTWDDNVKDLYEKQARKFLFVNVPSQERSPLIKGKSAADQAAYLDFKNKLNAGLAGMTQAFKNNHPDAQVACFDSSAFLGPILDDPVKYGFNKDNACSDASKKCVWNNDFHTTTVVHDLMAKAMVKPMKTLGY